MKRFTWLFSLFLISTIIMGQSFEFKQYIVPQDTGRISFGSSISITGSQMIVGSMFNSTDEYYGNKRDNAGAAYIYSYQSGNWVMDQKIVASDRTNNSFFGVSVNVTIGSNGAEFLIGADEADYSSTPIYESGIVYYFTKTGNSWTEKQKIVPSDVNAGDRVGTTICRVDNDLFIESSSHDYDKQGQNYLENAGAVYYFKLIGGAWIEQQKIVAYDRTETDEVFGRSLTFNGSHLFIGSLNGYDENGSNYKSKSGSVYIYTKDGNGEWIFKQKIRASDIKINDGFGTKGMDANGNRLVVGSRNSFDENGANEISNAGSVYVFKKDGNDNWNEEQKLISKHRMNSAEFGHSVTIDGSTIAVGTPYDLTDELNQNTLPSEGAVYVFRLKMNSRWEFDEKVVAANRNGGSLFGTAVDINSYDLVATSEKDRAGTQFQNGSAHYFSNAPSIGIRKVKPDVRLNIYPNPVKSELIIDSDQPVRMIQIFDQQGKMVIEGGYLVDRKVDVSTLRPSSYFTRIYIDGQVVHRKFIKIN